MLQLSTGKYFDDDKKIFHEKRFLFYSNCQLNNGFNIPSPKLSISQIKLDVLSQIQVDFTLITEDHPVIADAGKEDFISQFLLVWSFYFNCIARTQETAVRKICNAKKYIYSGAISLPDIAPKTAALHQLRESELADFTKFFDNLMSLNRRTYDSIIAVFKILDDSKETLSTNFDLAYSTLVYALESLSQRHDNYTSSWSDYDQNMRKELDKILNGIDSEKSDAIKATLIRDKQFCLTRRFLTFVNSNVDDDYFSEHLGENIKPMRKAYLNQCLKNLYDIRSSYVHELKPFNAMMSFPYLVANDFIEVDDQPYFTYSGLIRLLRNVILNFINDNKTNNSEAKKINWTQYLRGCITIPASAYTWIDKPEIFSPELASKWFYELTEMLNNRDSATVIDQALIMRKIETIFDNSLKTHKTPLYYYYQLYNCLCIPDSDRLQYEKFLKKWKGFDAESIYHYVVIVYLNSLKKINNLNFELENFDTIFLRYSNDRFKKNSLNLSGFTEAALLSTAGNIALKRNETIRYQSYLKQALIEIVWKQKQYRCINYALQNRLPVDMVAYFSSDETGNSE